MRWSENHTNLTLGTLLMVYLLGTGIGAGILVIQSFPSIVDGALTFPNRDAAGLPTVWPFGAQTPEQAFLALAFLTGIAGSFLHGAQSLSSYLGNRTFEVSWTAWYLLRPPIGGLLGLVIYFVIRAGLMGGSATEVNPHSVAALGALGGWFSKTATDKLQEVFETFFKTDADKQRANKLEPMPPVIVAITPADVQPDVNTITIKGDNFFQGALLMIEGEPTPTTFESPTQLTADLTSVARGREVKVWIQNGVAGLASTERVLTLR
jgi:hypothetical protein